MSEMELVETPTFIDVFERTEDEAGHYAVANDGSNLVVMIRKETGVNSRMFMRRIIKPADPSKNASLLVAELNGVFLYVSEDNKFILTTDGELR